MTARRAAADPHQVLEALAAAGSPLSGCIIPRFSLDADVSSAVALIPNLVAYRTYLAQARAYKASGAGIPGEIDKQVLSAARQAVSDLQTATVTAVQGVQSLSQGGGAFDEVMSAWVHALKANGSISVGDVWGLFDTAANRELLAAAGVDGAAVGEFAAAVKPVAELRFTAYRSLLRLQGTANGVKVDTSIATGPGPLLAADIGALLNAGRFDALADLLEQGEPAYLYGMPLGADSVRFEDVAMAVTLASQQEGAGHLRKLEDTGLDTHTGGAPGVALVVGLGLLIAAIYGLSQCNAKNDGGGDAGQASGWCLVGVILTVVFLAIGLGAANKKDPTPPGGPTGTPLIRGVLTDLQRSPELA